MKTAVVFFIGLALPISLYGQFYSASSALLQSGIVHGTERERHFSMRLQALGANFSGYVADQITDLYRNPAFFHRLERPLLFGELVRQQQISRLVPVTDARAVVISSAIPRAWAKNASNFGALLRGNYAQTPFRANGAFEAADYHVTDMTYREDRDNWTEAQLIWGFPVFGRFSAGVSYTYGINEIRNFDESARTSYLRQTFFSGNTRTSETQRSAIDKNDHVDKSHTLRLGLLREGARDASWDAVATLEFLSANPARDSRSRNNRRESSSSPYAVSDTVTQNHYLRTAHLKATNIRLDLRYRNAANATRTFVAQLGVGMAFFSSEDKESSFYYYQTYRTTSSGASNFSRSSRYTLDAAPDGFGFQVKGGVGWTFQRNNFLFAVAALGSYRRLKYDDTAREEYAITTQSFPPFTYPALSIPYDHALAQYRLALPLGMEYQAAKGLHLRAGWVAQFRGAAIEGNSRAIDEDSSDEGASRLASYRLDVSTVTFGMGYQIFDRLRADLLNFGDLSKPQDWNLSVIYNF